MIEESLNQLPFTKCIITTPTGASYNGLKYQKGNCGVSIVRSGEAMEQVIIMIIIIHKPNIRNVYNSFAIKLKNWI